MNELQQRLIQELQGIDEPLQVQAFVDAIGKLGYQIVLDEQSQLLTTIKTGSYIVLAVGGW